MRSAQSPDRPSETASRRCRAAWACWFVFVGVLANTAHANPSKEYQLKAAFLYNFTKFIEWPAARFADETSPIVIAIAGPNPFGDALERAVRGRKVNGRELVVRQISSLTEATSAHLVFVTADESGRLSAMREALHDAHVLTVGETPAFAEADGAITFSLEGDKLRFGINLKSSERARIKISAQLLKLATAVSQ